MFCSDIFNSLCSVFLTDLKKAIVTEGFYQEKESRNSLT